MKKARKMKTENWKMPVWMEKYRNFISNTGGNSIEELVNDDGINSNVLNNAPRALICVAVKCQVGLLVELHRNGLIA